MILMNKKTITIGTILTPTLTLTPTLALLLLVTTTPAAAITEVSIDAPEYVSGTFDVAIKVVDASNLKSGYFNLSFDSEIVAMTDIHNGEIEETVIRIDDEILVGANPANITFNVTGTDSVSGDGHLATVRFRAVGNDNDITHLNLSGGSLTDVNGGQIDSGWTNDTVTIRSMMTHVYVKNLDDDRLDVYLYIDGDFRQFEDRISSGATEEFGSYKLKEGSHTFRISWFDPDAEKWYNDTEERVIAESAAVAVVLHADEHDEDEDKISAHVYVKNLDDSELDIHLYIDCDFIEYKTVQSSETGDFGEHEFEKDEDKSHSFKIEWFDPKTGEDYEKIVRRYIDDAQAVTIFVNRNPYHSDDASSPGGEVVEVSTPVSAPFSASAPESSPSSAPVASTAPAMSGLPWSMDVPEVSEVSELSEIPSGTTFDTDPIYENFGYHLTTAYIMIGLVSVLFAMARFGKV